MLRRFALVFAAFFAFTLPLSAQTVESKLAQELTAIFPTLSKGYIDLNGNGVMDQLDDMDEVVAETRNKDNVLQVQEILDFISKNFRFISLEKLKSVQKSMAGTTGAISEIISLTYGAEIDRIIQAKIALGTDIYLSPSAMREAAAAVQQSAGAMAAAFKTEGREGETAFVAAREKFLDLMKKGYPLDGLGGEDKSMVVNAMMHLLLKDRGASVENKKTAISVLGRLEASVALPVLLETLKDAALKLETIRALGQIRDASALPPLFAMYDSASPDEVPVLAQAIGRLGGKDGIDKLVSSLETLSTRGRGAADAEQERVLLASLIPLAEKNTTDRRLRDVFTRYLKSDKPVLRILAVRGLVFFNPTETGPVLVSMLKEEPAEEARVAIIAALGGQKGNTAVIPAFILMLKNEATTIASRVAILAAISGNPEGSKAVTQVLDELDHPDSEVREAASGCVTALYRENPKAVSATLARGITTSQDLLYQIEGSRLLAEMADPDTVNTLIQMLQNPSPEVRRNASWALFRIRPALAKAAEELSKLVNSETEPLDVRTNAVRALGAMGFDSPQLNVWKTMLTVLKMRDDKYTLLKLYAAEALGSLGRGKPDVALEIAKSALREKDSEHRMVCLRALRGLQLNPPGMTDALAALFKRENDRELRILILEVLGDTRLPETAQLAGTLDLASASISDIRRVMYALGKCGSVEALDLVVSLAKRQELQEYAWAVLTDADRTVSRRMLSRRLQTEKDRALVDFLTSVQESVGAGM